MNTIKSILFGVLAATILAICGYAFIMMLLENSSMCTY